MTAFSEEYAEAIKDLLEEFGDDLVYHEVAADAGRSIVGIVKREVPKPVPGVDNQLLPVTTITVARDSSTGIPTITVGVNTVEVGVQDGGTAVEQVITGIVSQSAAHFEFQVS